MSQEEILPLPAIWYFFSCVAIASCGLIDLRTRLIPNRITYPFLVGTLILSMWFGVAIPSLLGALVTGSVLLVPRLIAGPKRAGLGDVKLALLGGMLLGVENGIYALLVASIAALVVLTPLMLLKYLRWRQAVPFGPFLAFGFITVLLVVWIGSSL